MAPCRQTMTDEQRKSAALEYLIALSSLLRWRRAALRRHR
jgi:hypothetical protein